MRLIANPVTADGSSYQQISEQEAFLWFDEAYIYARGGSGGSGSNAVKFGKSRQHVAPSGGNGGKGGDIILTIDRSSNTLLGFRGKSTYKAENGFDGQLEYANGRNGQDLIIPVPSGTIIRDNSTNEIVGEINEITRELVVSRGGLGGRGNAGLKAERGQRPKGSPAEGGEKKWLRLELKLVADIGLVGVPNAGKSTLLDAITNAKPKIAPYPFTTIVPNLGVCEMSDTGEAIVIADIPGLIEGAHLGVGLGRGFLRHIERCKIIIHLVNGDSVDPIHDFIAINKELLLFSPKLAMKPQIVVLNKIDLPHVKAKSDELIKKLKENMSHSRILAISAAGRIGLDLFKIKTYLFLKKLKMEEEKIESNDQVDKSTP
eukprot:gene18568-24291_t